MNPFSDLFLILTRVISSCQTAVDYGIRSIPTLILFKNGVRVDTIIGAVPKATLEAKLAQNI
jgi:thioredoxin-like negative regulator of GroEL